MNNTMKNLILFLTTILILISCCDDDPIKESYPKCLELRIQQVLDSPPQTPRASIEKYSYIGQIVYAFDSSFPDDFIVVYDDSCIIICQFGGFDGSLNDTCPDFGETAVLIETVWTDKR